MGAGVGWSVLGIACLSFVWVEFPPAVLLRLLLRLLLLPLLLGLLSLLLRCVASDSQLYKYEYICVCVCECECECVRG